MPVDRLRRAGAAGHGADQQGRPQAPTPQLQAAIDGIEVNLRQRLVQKAIAPEPGGDPLALHIFFEADADMVALTLFDGHSGWPLFLTVDKVIGFIIAQRTAEGT
jgi:hypothetical protein